ncbi:unnamed protein product [Rotaria sp. Silwood1]|nr:unnamed protein product [Rotaria sp. Silwood1]CAF1491570.1 unnamed protein product [Rotaria sp. Silwood1]CAF1513740.1 unnamed protein product [Rotaria sp. Silwood1]CAF3652569.1 unnamed protein product [Rotaria sp. Silwood1]
MEKQYIGSYIKTRWLLGLTATQIHDELTTAYGQDVVSYCTVTRWIQRFSNERESLEDNPRSGRPLSAIIQQNIDAVKDKRPSSTANHVKLHHDNARPHVNDIVLNCLQEEKIKVMAHPPYSSDLASSDFWLFSYLKRSLDTYPDATSLAKALSKELNSIPIHQYQKTFQKWIQKMKLCIEHHGDYFEHLL